MSSTFDMRVSQSHADLRIDLSGAQNVGTPVEHGDVHLSIARGAKNMWLRIARDGITVAALRAGANAGNVEHVQRWSQADGQFGVEWLSVLGVMRAKLNFTGRDTLRCTTSIRPSADVRLSAMPRDLVMLGDDGGTVFTSQRGLRSGIVFAGSRVPSLSLLYFQNFSSLSDFFSETKQTPADSVGGTWPELGFALPTGNDATLPQGREWVVSDAYLTFAGTAPASDDAIAALYLDLLAETYLAIDRPAPEYRAWNERAAETLRDLSLSPACTYERQGRRFLMPYVGDMTKPPESMVQFTVAVNAAEYDTWRGSKSALEARLRGTIPAFFNPDIGSIVRWLPGETFDAAQAEDNMSHEAMDSWYLHHSLFNAARFGHDGDLEALELFRKSLPYLVRVAHRFDYRWPIFFNLKTLDIIRAEAAPGAGGETDVAGMYALVMLHAYELFGDADYLHEAEVALDALQDLGFTLAYQLNTTGFAAEAAMRMYKITGKARYLGISEICLANIFDNMWLWQCDYGHARHYPTFFGLFPLRDAPYLAPYEELEAHAKFNELLQLGGDDVRPSLRLLIAEFQKYSLSRCWHFYPDALPVDVLAEKTRNGRIVRSLAIPLEDLQDGLEASGQVGQEIYGAGIPFVMTARHYVRLPDRPLLAYADYPMYDFDAGETGEATWRAGGDPRCAAELRVIPNGPDVAPYAVSAWACAGENRVPLAGTTSAEGHAVFAIRGGQTIAMRCTEGGAAAPEAVRIGTMNAIAAQ